MPTHPAADNGGQRHLVRETVAGFFIGQALHWEKQLTPSQHGHPALLPQGTDQAREGHGRDVPITAPQARLSPPWGANRASRATSGRLVRERQTHCGRTVHPALHIVPWMRQRGRAPKRTRASWAWRGRPPPALPLPGVCAASPSRGERRGRTRPTLWCCPREQRRSSHRGSRR